MFEKKNLVSLIFTVSTALLPHFSLAKTPAPGNGRIDSFGGTSIYIPANHKKEAGLVVYLHGCTQLEQHAMEVTRLNEWADKKGFAVLYPRQSVMRNPLLCWRWYLASEARRGGTEAQGIVNLIKSVQDYYGLNSQKTYVMGLSAGGAMTQILLACYPEIFTAGASHSGVVYTGEGSSVDPLKVMAEGSPESNAKLAQYVLECMNESQWRKPIPFMSITGTHDDVVHYSNSLQSSAQFLLASEILKHGEIKSLPHSDAKLEMDLKSKARKQNELKHKICTHYLLPEQPIGQTVVVDGLGHAWSGGKEGLPYSDSRGPDATKLIIKFFDSIGL